MSEQERLELSQKLDKGLKEAYESMLRKKALLDETVIITDDAGNPIEVSAKEVLAEYLAEKK
jgi:ribosomal protein L7Ae-like RNA K-turn-binding protein